MTGHGAGFYERRRGSACGQQLRQHLAHDLAARDLQRADADRPSPRSKSACARATEGSPAASKPSARPLTPMPMTQTGMPGSPIAATDTRVEPLREQSRESPPA